MPTPTPQDIAAQLEAYRITVAVHENTVRILTSDLAKATVKAQADAETIASLNKQIEDLKPKPPA